MKNVVSSYRAPRPADHYVSIGHRLGRVFAGIRRWRQRNQAIRELSALSDPQLQDIGLTRSEIVTAVDGLLRPKATQGTIVTLSTRPHREVPHDAEGSVAV